MSQLSSIYTALAAKTVTSGSITPVVFNLSALPQSVETAHTPCRLLLPFNNDMGSDAAQYIAIGQTMTINWKIVDLCLWQESDQGIGLPEHASAVVDYAAAYVDMAKTFRAPTSQSVLTGLNITQGMFEFPRGSNRWYAGVMCQLDVMEVVNA